MSDPYTIFHKAADHLVSEYLKRRVGIVNPAQPIPPVMAILSATVERNTEILSPYHFKPHFGLVLSHIEDKAGPIPECYNRFYSVKADALETNCLPIINQGERIQAHVMMSIKPPRSIGTDYFSINYHREDGSYRLGFQEVVRLEKV